MKKLLFAFGITALTMISCAEKTAAEKIEDGLEETLEGVNEKSEEMGKGLNNLLDKASEAAKAVSDSLKTNH